MIAQNESGRRRRPVTVVALLFGLLLGVAANGAQLRSDPGKARIGTGEVLRTASNHRIASRSDDDRLDDESATPPLPPPPRVVVALVPVSRAVAGVPTGTVASPRDRHFAYRARAPPAV